MRMSKIDESKIKEEVMDKLGSWLSLTREEAEERDRQYRERLKKEDPEHYKELQLWDEAVARVGKEVFGPDAVLRLRPACGEDLGGPFKEVHRNIQIYEDEAKGDLKHKNERKRVQMP